MYSNLKKYCSIITGILLSFSLISVKADQNGIFKNIIINKYQKISEVLPPVLIESFKNLNPFCLNIMGYHCWKQLFLSLPIEERQAFLIDITKKSDTGKLFAYNLLRELSDQDSFQFSYDVDNEYLKILQQDLHKQALDKALVFNNKEEFLKNLTNLSCTLLQNLRNAQQAEQIDPVQILLDYNALQVMYERPTITDITHIDYKWIEDTLQANLALQALDSGIEYKLANFAENELVREAKEATGVKRDLPVFIYPDKAGAAANNYYLAISSDKDLDLSRAIIYHELAHYYYEDQKKPGSYDTAPTEYTLLFASHHLKTASVKKALKLIEEYVQKAKSVLNTHSAIGKRLLKFLEKHPILYIKSERNDQIAQDIYLWQALLFSFEYKADLWACNKLYEHNKINSILSLIYFHAIECADRDPKKLSTHPSSIERALYMIGFLATKGLDVNAELKKWEKSGVCVSREAAFKHVAPFYDQTQSLKEKLETVARKRAKEVQPENYQKLKEQLLQELSLDKRNTASVLKQFSEAISSHFKDCTDNGEDLTICFEEAQPLIDVYNVMRESIDGPKFNSAIGWDIIANWAQINSMVLSQSPEVHQKEFFRDFKQKKLKELIGLETLNQKAIDVLSDLSEALYYHFSDDYYGEAEPAYYQTKFKEGQPLIDVYNVIKNQLNGPAFDSCADWETVHEWLFKTSSALHGKARLEKLAPHNLPATSKVWLHATNALKTLENYTIAALFGATAGAITPAAATLLGSTIAVSAIDQKLEEIAEGIDTPSAYEPYAYKGLRWAAILATLPITYKFSKFAAKKTAYAGVAICLGMQVYENLKEWDIVKKS